MFRCEIVNIHIFLTEIRCKCIVCAWVCVRVCVCSAYCALCAPSDISFYIKCDNKSLNLLVNGGWIGTCVVWVCTARAQCTVIILHKQIYDTTQAIHQFQMVVNMKNRSFHAPYESQIETKWNAICALTIEHIPGIDFDSDGYACPLCVRVRVRARCVQDEHCVVQRILLPMSTRENKKEERKKHIISVQISAQVIYHCRILHCSIVQYPHFLRLTSTDKMELFY